MIEAIKTEKKSGTEDFILEDKNLDINVLNFWQWSASDLLTNRQRGILAEYIVASVLKLDSKPRSEWDAFDLTTEDDVKIEIKSASYIQSWEQKEFSKISFSIQPTVKWDGYKRTTDRKRQSDIYVFCLIANKDIETINPLDLNQWKFYIIKTSKLDDVLGNQKTLSLSKLEKLQPIIAKYDEISKAIDNLKRESINE